MKTRPTAHLKGGKMCVRLPKMTPGDYNRPCPWMTRQDMNSSLRAPSEGSRKHTSAPRAASQRKPKQNTNQSFLGFYFSFFFSNLIKTPERLSHDLALFIAPSYPLRAWRMLSGAMLAKEQFPPLGPGMGTWH